VLDSSPRLRAISPRLGNESENTLHIGLFKSGALGSKAFSRRTRGWTLDNMLNCGPGKACGLPDLAIALPLPAERANGSTNRSSPVLIRLVVLKNGRREDI
jgi:hypothetical protein